MEDGLGLDKTFSDAAAMPVCPVWPRTVQRQDSDPHQLQEEKTRH